MVFGSADRRTRRSIGDANGVPAASAGAEATDDGPIRPKAEPIWLDLGAIGPFDAVLDNHLLHCIVGPDPGRALAEMRRVLRPGGTLFLETMTCEDSFDADLMNADPVSRVARNGSRFWATRDEVEAV